MKQMIILLAIVSITINSFAQGDPHSRVYAAYSQPHDSTYYINKSSSLNTAGWLLLGTGPVLMLTGYLVYQNNVDTDWLGLNMIPGIGCMVLGGAAIITSIPLLITASNYKKKALGVSLSLQGNKFPCLQGSMVGFRYVPALSVKISL
ncbi:MAG TPA: hypothetical protein VMI35_03900 [Puia sp.]|nr:hypothetical protein [Puia sp.]